MDGAAPNTGASKSLFVLVGDLSADKHTARLLEQLKTNAPDLRVWGVGGPAMIAQGFESMHNCQDFSVVGIVEALPQILFLRRMRNQLLQKVADEKPDAILFVDYGAFNLRFGRILRRQGCEIPIIYFISPQVWGSRPWRIKTVAETVSKMLVIFPFEEALYTRRDVPAKFVGHPLTRNIPTVDQLPDRDQFCESHGLDPSKFIVGVFPGSRKQEIKDLLPVTTEAMRQLLNQRSDVQFIISRANERISQLVGEVFTKTGLIEEYGDRIKLAEATESYSLMANSDIVWAKSGTTTLETTLFGKPMLIFYKGAWLSYILVMLYKTVRRFGWPNLLAGEDLVPELIQLDCRPQQLVRYTRDLLDVPGLRQEISQRLLALRDQLGHGDYASSCVDEILKTLKIAPSN